jgi:hypothetical protein
MNSRRQWAGFISGAYTHNVMSTTELESLSILQRELLKKALVAHYREPGCWNLVRVGTSS